jgi:nitroimidazol reductase NimA-like FMN-containing flavoprotein (pyridoxamine 5'-phosphate oxidase superfamily)
MRRRELASDDPALFAEVAGSAEIGHFVILTPDGWPRAVAVNFCAVGERIYFHGALAGEKHAAVAAGDARVGFMMYLPYSMIPSYWSAPGHACPATQFFKSVEVKGRCTVVADPAEKAVALTALMQKYQPEAGYDPIDPADRRYARAVADVGVYRIDPESWSGKVKFGQNEPSRLRRRFVAELRARGLPLDLATADEIEKTLAPESAQE